MPAKSCKNFSIDVCGLISGRQDQITRRARVLLDEAWGVGALRFVPGSEVGFEVRLGSVSGGITARGRSGAWAEGECSACLIFIKKFVEVEFNEFFAYARGEGSDYSVSGGCVDLTPLCRDSLVLALPFAPLCGPGCRPNSIESAPAAVGSPWSALATLLDPSRESKEKDGGS